MAQRALPQPAARLGRAVHTAGALSEVSGVVLLLPDGETDSRRRPSTLSYAAQRPLARTRARAGAEDGLAVHVVRYHRRGWNSGADPAADAGWAADEVQRRYGDVPVCLVGHGMGGRAALRAAGHTAVTSVMAMAPWLPEAAAPEPGAEPVKHLAGRRVLIVHGTNDARTDPELSYRLAERAKKTNRDTCRFEVHSDGHALRQHRSEVVALAVDFVRGSLFGGSYARPLTDAFAAPPPLGLRMPLAAGFGRSLRN